MNSHPPAARLASLLGFVAFIALIPLGHARQQLVPAPIRVDAFALPGGDGSGWNNALNSLDTALQIQQPGGQIWVKQGNYFPSSTGTGFLISKQLLLYGGFFGDETYLQDRHGSFAGTILDGTGCQHVVSIPQLVGNSGTPGIVIDGFMIKNGNSLSNGGGIICQYWDLDLANLFVQLNHADFNGGGLYFQGVGIGSPGLTFHTLHIKSCEFRGNSLSPEGLDGGAIYGTNVTGEVVNTSFIQDGAPRHGGGVFLGMTPSPDRFDFTNCVFWQNAATSTTFPGKGGGITWMQATRCL